MAHFTEEASVYKFASALINNTKGLGEPGDTDFVFRENMLFNALLSYIYYETLENEKDMKSLTLLLENMIADNDHNGFRSATDYLFDDKQREEPWHTAPRLYNDFKSALSDGEQGRRIVESCLSRIAPLNTPEMIAFTSKDELKLDNLKNPKTALFIIDGDAAEDIKFLVPLVYSQLLDVQHSERNNHVKPHTIENLGLN